MRGSLRGQFVERSFFFALKKRKAQCTTVGEPENAMKRRKALLP